MDKKELVLKLINFMHAFDELEDAFEQFEHKGKDCNDYIVKNYPFDKSFDELNYEVVIWVNECVERLNKE